MASLDVAEKTLDAVKVSRDGAKLRIVCDKNENLKSLFEAMVEVLR